ncbi:MAG: homocysteine S-methyltransferase family protein [Eubacteriales bacterium]
MTLHDIYKKFPRSFPLPMLLDGATGTSLMRDGMPRGCCTEKWVLENPSALENIQRSYYAAGSDAVMAPTFGGNRAALRRHGMDGDADFVNRSLISLTCGVRASFYPDKRLVAGDMSPTGRFIEPWGDASLDDIAAIYASQAASLNDSADFFIIETSISLAEVRAAVLGVKSVSDKPVFVTMTVDERGRTMSGDTLLCCLITLADMGVSAFGANCSTGPDKMLTSLSPLAAYARAFGIPLIAKPNAGMPRENADGTQSFEMTAADFGLYAEKFLAGDIYILGGCCGTTDAHIAALRTAIDAYSESAESKVNCGGDIPDISRLICTNSRVCTIDDTLEAVSVADIDDFDEVNEDGDQLFLRLNNMDDAERLCDEMISLTRPLSVCGDAGAVKYFTRRFVGRAAVRNI